MTRYWLDRPLDNVASYTRNRAPDWLQLGVLEMIRQLVLCRLKRHLGARVPLRRIVDLGCGVGDWSLAYLELATWVTGVEINPRFIARARQAARGHDLGHRATFVEGDLVTFDDYRDADLVTLGACVQYLTDAQFEGLLDRLDRAGIDRCYLRTTVNGQGRGPLQTPTGIYRTRRCYEARFARHGWTILDTFYSLQLPLEALAAELCGGSRRLARVVGAPLWAVPLRLRDLLGAGNAHSWILGRDMARHF